MSEAEGVTVNSSMVAPLLLLVLKTLTLSPEKHTPVDPEAEGAVTIQGVAESAMVLLDDGVALCITQMLRMQRIPIAKAMLAAPNEMLLVPILMIGRSLIVQV